MPVGFLRHRLRRRQRRAGRQHRQFRRGLRHDDDGQVGDGLDLAGNICRARGEDHLPVVVGRRHVVRARAQEFRAKGELRVDPGELAVVHPRHQMNVAACVFRDLQPEVNRVCGPRRNQVHVHRRAVGPGVALVGGIAVRVNGQRAVKLRAGIHGALALILHHAAPEEDLALIVGGFQFQPAVEGIDRSSGEEVPHADRAHHHVHASGLARHNGSLHTIERRGHGSHIRLASHAGDVLLRLFAHGEGRLRLHRCGGCGLDHVIPARLGRNRENVHAHLMVLQEALRVVELLLVLVHERQRGIGCDEAMRADESVDFSGIVGAHRRHVAIHAILRMRRIVERTRAEAGNAAGLPVVVIVEAANPAVMVQRHVQVHLVARRAEVGGIVLHERLEECAPVRLGIFLDEEIDQLAQIRILRIHQLEERRIFDGVRAVAHGAAHVADGVAHHAADTGLRRRREDAVFDGRVEVAGKEQRGVVAARTPFRRLHAVHVLHVDDCLPVPLVVERGKMVRGAFPLAINVGVALLASCGVDEVILGHGFAGRSLRGAREKLALRSRAFGVHGSRRNGWVVDDVRPLPRHRAHPPGSAGDARSHDQAARQPRRGPQRRSLQAAKARRPSGPHEQQHRAAHHRNHFVGVEHWPHGPPRAGKDDDGAENSAEQDHRPAQLLPQAAAAHQAAHPRHAQHQKDGAEKDVKEDDAFVDERRRWKREQIDRAAGQTQGPGNQESSHRREFSSPKSCRCADPAASSALHPAQEY